VRKQFDDIREPFMSLAACAALNLTMHGTKTKYLCNIVLS
jgi:hypothetical protein